MSHPQRLSILRGATLAFAASMVVACGGGNGSSGGANPPPTGGGNPPPASPTTGTVAVVLRDFPNGEFCRIYADIERIDLLGQDGPTNLVEYVDPADDGRFDLLALQGSGQVLDVATDIPIGNYEKVRMTLDQLSLVECEGPDGLVEEPETGWEHPKIPGNGKLDLVPRGNITVIGGATLVIDIDMDMKKSLHLHQTGQGNGKWQFRPVIFVDILVDIDETKLVRVFGEARVSPEGADPNPFTLCSTITTSNGDADGMNGEMDQDRCIQVVVRTDPSGMPRIFDTDGGPDGVVTDGAPLTAIGFLSLFDGPDDDSRADDLRLDAVVVELGPQGTFQTLNGRASSALGNNDLFAFDTTPDDGDSSDAIDVLYQVGPILNITTNEDLMPAAIQPGVIAEVDGVFKVPATNGEPLNASLILLTDPSEPAESLLAREIAAKTEASPTTDPVTGTIDLAPVADELDCVTTDVDTVILQITEGAGSTATETIGFADLAIGDSVDVFGDLDPGNPTCVLATNIQKYVTAP